MGNEIASVLSDALKLKLAFFVTVLQGEIFSSSNKVVHYVVLYVVCVCFLVSFVLFTETDFPSSMI